LPEAQLDRFLFKLVVDFPDRAAEIAILIRHALQPLEFDARSAELRKVMTAQDLTEGRALVDSIRLDATILTYIVDLIRATRNDADILHGASTRAADALAGAVRARAAVEGRDYGLPDDVQALLLPVLRHRIVLGPSAEIEGRSSVDVLRNLLNRIDAPR
jgi:MoxR-like ATPase